MHVAPFAESWTVRNGEGAKIHECQVTAASIDPTTP
jgi:hypothetical protein